MYIVFVRIEKALWIVYHSVNSNSKNATGRLTKKD